MLMSERDSITLTLGNYPIYLPNGLSVGGIQVSPYGTLLGRPVFVSQHAKAMPTTGVLWSLARRRLRPSPLSDPPGRPAGLTLCRSCAIDSGSGCKRPWEVAHER